MALALDELGDSDEVYPMDGFQFIIGKETQKQLGNVSVDFVSYGFTIVSENLLAGTGGKDCSSCSCKS